jgi:hypothetical protein
VCSGLSSLRDVGRGGNGGLISEGEITKGGLQMYVLCSFPR